MSYGLKPDGTLLAKRRLTRLRQAGIAGVVAGLFIGLQLAQAGGTSLLDSVDTSQHRLDEADILARARAEHSPDNESLLSEPSRSPQNGDAIREQALQSEVDRRVAEAERQAELDEISARLKARAARLSSPTSTPPDFQLPSQIPSDGRVQAQAQVPNQAVSPQPNVTVRAAVRQNAPAGQHATIVLSMTPGYTGIRINNPTADPILCIADTCWISRGADQDARSVHRAKALGPLNTLGDRAGSCNNKTTCIFRNVDLGAPFAVIQPIDLRLVRHDRREARPVAIDTTCSVETGTVICTAPQDGPDYRLWLLAEPVAVNAGSSRIETFALGAPKPDPQIAIGHFR